ncbi:MAG: DNA repair protein RadC [Methyloceanibacter sp.]|nr:MAG: DNA repair protein RadC [Methyloceanibacter sp.]
MPLSLRMKPETLYKKYLTRLTLDRVYDAEVPQILNPEDAYRLLEPMSREAREVFTVLALDNRLYLAALDEIARGDTSSIPINVGEILKTVLVSNSYQFIVAHNHPSGDPTPSREDHSLTSRIEEAARILRLKCIDHIIVGDGRFYSMKEGRLRTC